MGKTEIQTNQKRDIKLFIWVMVAFTIGMAVLLVYDISAWYIWYIYFVIWTYIEYRIAKNIDLKWWHWLLIIGAIIAVDVLIFTLFE